MTTTSKDFVVKNGLVVTNGATFGDSVIIGQPTSNNHAATKLYVDNIVSSISGGSSVEVSNTEPSSPSNGDFWLDTNIDRLKVYYGGIWITLATYEDAEAVTQHVHDTSIDGTGFVIDTFEDSPEIGEEPIQYLDGGSPETTVFESVIDGGTI